MPENPINPQSPSPYRKVAPWVEELAKNVPDPLVVAPKVEEVKPELKPEVTPEVKPELLEVKVEAPIVPAPESTPAPIVPAATTPAAPAVVAPVVPATPVK